MKKYPILKCDEQLWKEIKPVLESFGIIQFANESFDNNYTNYIVSNWGAEDLDKLNIGITYDPIYNEIRTFRYLVNTKEEFLSTVVKLLGKEYPIISKNNKDMEKINIAEKLKHCKKGIKLYSSVYGEVEFIKVEDSVIYIKVLDITNETFSRSFNKNGMYDDFPDGECFLFPSKDNRDWNTFQLLEEGHRIMCSDDSRDWRLREYIKDCYAKTTIHGSKSRTCGWKYIVPIEDFDFTAEDITINKERSII